MPPLPVGHPRPAFPVRGTAPCRAGRPRTAGRGECLRPPGAGGLRASARRPAPVPAASAVRALRSAACSKWSEGSLTFIPEPLSVPATGPWRCWITCVSSCARVCRPPPPRPMTTSWPEVYARAPSSSAERCAAVPVCSRTSEKSAPSLASISARTGSFSGLPAERSTSGTEDRCTGCPAPPSMRATALLPIERCRAATAVGANRPSRSRAPAGRPRAGTGVRVGVLRPWCSSFLARTRKPPYRCPTGRLARYSARPAAQEEPRGQLRGQDLLPDTASHRTAPHRTGSDRIAGWRRVSFAGRTPPPPGPGDGPGTGRRPNAGPGVPSSRR